MQLLLYVRNPHRDSQLNRWKNFWKKNSWRIKRMKHWRNSRKHHWIKPSWIKTNRNLYKSTYKMSERTPGEIIEGNHWYIPETKFILTFGIPPVIFSRIVSVIPLKIFLKGIYKISYVNSFCSSYECFILTISSWILQWYHWKFLR